MLPSENFEINVTEFSSQIDPVIQLEKAAMKMIKYPSRRIVRPCRILLIYTL